MKGKDLDSFIRNFVLRNLTQIVLGVLLLASFVVRYHLMKHGSSNDYWEYIVPWVDSYKNSVSDSFREGVGNYYIPYNILLAIAAQVNIPTNYSVGIISCVFDYLTCIYIYRILSENFQGVISKALSATISVAYLFIPTIVLNGAAWKQCDAIYSFFIVVLIKCILDGKIRTAFIMFGIAFSFKQQAIFIVPLLIILYFINKNIKIIYCVYPVLVYLIAGLPAIVMGRSATEVYSIYFNQADTYHEMTMNYPNLYLLAMTQYEKCHIYAKLLTVFVFAIAFLYICKKMQSMSDKTIIALAVWSIWTCCMFLPAMHQRYDYMVAVLLVVCVPLVAKAKQRMALIGAVLFYLGNILTYSRSLFGDDYNNIFVFCCNGIAYALFCYILWDCIQKEAN